MGKNEPWTLEWIEILTDEGYAVLAPDLYGYGERMKRRDVPRRVPIPGARKTFNAWWIFVAASIFS